MISSIEMKNVATFDTVGIKIDDLKKVNFIYGANGSGKTTISNFISNQGEPTFTDCRIYWENDIQIKTLVFNKDFKEKNFGQSTIPGVFTIGQAPTSEIADIEGMRRSLMEIEDEGKERKIKITELSTRKEEQEEIFKENVWKDIYKKYEVVFNGAFERVKSKKEAFKDRVLEEFYKNNSTLESRDYLENRAKVLFQKSPNKLSLINIIDFDRLLQIESNVIWQKKIIGKADVEIAKLIQRLNINDWVNEGRNYLSDDEVCPFCQQKTISNTFRRQLESYFDETFTHDINLVKALAREYNTQAQNLINILLIVENNEKDNPESKLSMQLYTSLLRTVETQFISNKELLNNKIKEPSRIIDLISVEQNLENLKQLIVAANKAIKEHNTLVDNYQNERFGLIKSIWKYLIEENRQTISLFINDRDKRTRDINALQAKRDDLESRYRALKGKIREASRNITSVQASVDDINRRLISYGFTNFKIVESKGHKNQYQIEREDGTIAEKTLSEGEITFITFLYFMQLAKGSLSPDNITERRILVIDDPVSSLDSNVLYVVSSLIRDLIKHITDDKDTSIVSQLILLTHNVYFHKEASYKSNKKQTNYWILRRNKSVSAIQSFEKDNPIKNSYELLWQELKNKNGNYGVTIQNTMRRILETYFMVFGGYELSEMDMQFDKQQDQEIYRSLLCWTHDGSHNIPDDVYVEQIDNNINVYFDVFKAIFDKTNHIAHYNMMMCGSEELNN